MHQTLLSSPRKLLCSTLTQKYLLNVRSFPPSGALTALQCNDGHFLKTWTWEKLVTSDIATRISWLIQASYELLQSQFFLPQKTTTNQLSSVQISGYWSYIYSENNSFTFSSYMFDKCYEYDKLYSNQSLSLFIFLVADTRLNTFPCRSVGPSVT